jgi:hypothetical protein
MKPFACSEFGPTKVKLTLWVSAATLEAPKTAAAKATNVIIFSEEFGELDLGARIILSMCEKLTMDRVPLSLPFNSYVYRQTSLCKL